MSSQELTDVHRKPSDTRAKTEYKDATQRIHSAQSLLQDSLQGRRDFSDNAGPQKPPTNDSGTLTEAAKRGTAKPSYRGVRQRPWGEATCCTELYYGFHYCNHMLKASPRDQVIRVDLDNLLPKNSRPGLLNIQRFPKSVSLL